MKIILVFIVSVILLGCSSQDINDYADNKPVFSMTSFFQGDLKAEGIVKGFNGRVIRTFTADLQASWNDKTLTLDEQFLFSDGEKQNRTWVIQEIGENSYTGTANDIPEQASGVSAGNALNWKYAMVLNVDDSEYNVEFDDWIYQISDNVVINQTVIYKWGVQVGEVVLVIRK
ncbi:DUF3833 domain-containing protein [Aliivibrio sp. S4TY2]|uniref:DUF3833 domain-containing protein n=1 Tax=unclassified Aliivibrio TaxID=2645654 RepID=UPI0023784369|nr:MULTISPECIES: DUF3833 domain-containing protein [unclassified Aliivibrio]MDD9156341.1 DUF3833 domain-containing protein [Aliivibrio sp. S4TY2]MDD9160688.1 DUF3833 domain-containing protein [Aliivibrio sp. S4TY1]MDD9164049.1 DUF3833 domain-containing protein [Aliivibrio sp. S4MY2]MDD9167977.1 DUF3833 domain-containing protein [Aliivibrio sp. S4MY4]MDD9185245.1 DUF3833 domain-containing protein [Aliivibrio sp. S4MY3]